jgi:hypothetical protein
MVARLGITGTVEVDANRVWQLGEDAWVDFDLDIFPSADSVAVVVVDFNCGDALVWDDLAPVNAEITATNALPKTYWW